MSNNVITLLLSKAREYKAKNYRGDEEACLQQVLEYDPNHVEALSYLADIRISQKKYAAALALNHSVLRTHTTDLIARVNWAENASLCKLDEVSHQSWARVLSLQPNNPHALLKYSNYWYTKDDFESVYPYIKKATELAPNDASVAMSMAKVLTSLRRFKEAEEWFLKAIKREPDLSEFQWEYAMLLLVVGRFEEGWDAYESRLRVYHPYTSGLQYFPFPFEAWQGQPLENKTILVHGEQGLGDEIMFGSMIRDLLGMGADVIFGCVPTLVKIFARSFPKVVIYNHSRGEQDVAFWHSGGIPAFLPNLQNIDYQSTLGSLARWLRPNIGSFNSRARKPYMKPDQEKSDKYEEQILSRMRKDCEYKVGLVWTGNLTTGKLGECKSIPLSQLAVLAHDKVQFISLQNAEYGKGFDTVPELNLMDFCDQLVDFDETAALINNCDLVISIDTSVCHLSGALGKKTWVPLRFASDWRYVVGRDDCLWYKDMRLFSQKTDGDWSPVVRSLRLALDEWME